LETTKGENPMFAIEKNIPPPDARTRTSEYNFHELQVGDSIYIPGASYDANRAFWAAQKYFSRNSKKITSKKEGDGIRIWRIK
jgi:hypothetical protein